MTDVAYVKGAFFLKTIEAKVGRQKMDVFLESYFDHFKFTSVSTKDFIDYLNQELLEKYIIDFDYKEWIFNGGIPDNCIEIESKSFQQMEDFAKSFASGKDIFSTAKGTSAHSKSILNRSDYSVQEWLTFIRNLPENLTITQMEDLDDKLSFTSWTNAEIQFEWFLKAISTNYQAAYPNLKAFLKKVGRRKFILPLYSKMYEFEHSKEQAVSWFKDFKQNYHAVSSNSIKEALAL
jgi:hypothetical protein